MSIEVADSIDDLLDETINVNQPLDWEFLGGGGGSAFPYDRGRSYRAGECVTLPNGEMWCAARNVSRGDAGPGETGWKYAWRRVSELIGEDPAASAAYRQRHHGRAGVSVGALVADVTSLDLLGADPLERATEATRKVITRARDAKAPTLPPDRVVEYDEEDEISISPTQLEILGSIDAPERKFPIVSDLYRKFQRKSEPKFVRLDTEQSYRDFRTAGSPELLALRERVEALEALVYQHVADGHGAQDTIVGLASDVSKLQSAHEEKRVQLQMPPWAEGTWDCWREDGPNGGIVCCSIALPGHDGNVRICTTATPVKGHVEDVVGYTNDVGCDVVELLGVLPTISCMLAGGRLMTEMAAAAPAVLAHPSAQSDRPFIGKIVPANKPSLAVLIALCQKAQSGDAGATNEWGALAKIAESNSKLAESMSEARRRLIMAQSVVGERWSQR